MTELIDRWILRRLSSAKNILDIGCGDGRLVNFLAYHSWKKVVGLDVSSQGFTKAFKMAVRSHIAELID